MSVFFVVIVVVVVTAVAIIVNTVTRPKPEDRDSAAEPVYKNAAVASDSQICSKIGVEILQANGSAMDAAIATLFALGVVHPHSSGIGGGGFMLVYERATKQARYFDFRETAPAATTQDMFDEENSKTGMLAIAVPCEVLGMHKAWLIYGKLPWKRLLEPAINLAAHGFKIDEPLGGYIETYQDVLSKETGFRDVYYDAQGASRKQGEIVTDPVFANTLREISENPLSMYNGSLAQEIVRDMQQRGGIITEDDLKNVTVIERDVLVTSMSDDDTLYTTSAPTSGATLVLILNILKGFKFTAESLSITNVVQTWHKVLEAFKFGFAYRPYLADPDFNPEVKESERLQIDASFAEQLRQQICTNTTHETSYYGSLYRNEPDHGTTHLSVLSPNGDAVSVTSTVGQHFGSKRRSHKTGIVYNDHIDLYSFPNISKPHQPKPAKVNYIAPGKRPVSTICPTIVTHPDGSVKMIVGSSGGHKIVTAVATVLIKKLWIGLTLEQCISQPRLHHQLHPNEIWFESNEKFQTNEAVIEGLHALGHKVASTETYCAVQGVYRDKSGQIDAMSDPRKKGKAAGY